MEKRIAHYHLSTVKALVEGGNVRATVSALSGGAALGFDFAGILGVVSALTVEDFHKSMTTLADHRVWQDVYQVSTGAGDVYVKLTVVNELVIVSFKEL